MASEIGWGNIQLKRRYHPHGHTIYDVTEDGAFLGVLTHPGGWFAFAGYSDTPIAGAASPTRAEALATLVLHTRKSGQSVSRDAPTPKSSGIGPDSTFAAHRENK